MKTLKMPLILFFLLTIGVTIITAALSVNQHDYNDILFIMALCLNGVFIILTILEILNSKIFNGNEKALWVVIVLFLNIIGAVLYLIIGRKQFTNSAKVT